MPGREGALISVPYYSISQFHTLCQWMIGVVRVRLASPLLNESNFIEPDMLFYTEPIEG